MNPRLSGFLIRSTTFLRKEVVEVIRQPQLILILIIGPFLILLLFGLGYRSQARVLKTLFVVSQDNPYKDQVASYASDIGPQLDFVGITDNREQAISQLVNGSVDLVVIVPDNAEQSIRDNQQVVLELYHDEIDPFQVSYVKSMGRIYIDAINRRLLRDAYRSGESEASNIDDSLQSAKQNVATLQSALQMVDSDKFKQSLEQLNSNLDLISRAISTGLFWARRASIGVESRQTIDRSIEVLLSTLETINQTRAELEKISQETQGLQENIQRVNQLKQDIDMLEKGIEAYRNVDPFVLVSPFRTEAHSIAQREFDPTEFFTPAVIVLLVQHFAVTLASLSLVREKRSGVFELFRVSPISAFETLLGKYVSFLAFDVLLSAIITAVVVWLLGVPMLGPWLAYSLVILALIFTSLGAGFLFSLAAETEIQAVQYSMLFLLASIFFGGFFLDLRMIWEPVRIISWTLPTTYAIRLLHNVMLRGYSVDSLLLISIVGIGILLFVVDWYWLHRRIRQA